jgi:hypothetical protein
MLAVSSCSKPSQEGSSGSGGVSDLVSKLTGSEPWHTPKYPPHPSVQPSVAPSTFSSGETFDWETPMKETPTLPRYRFANTRTFAETTAWIKKTVDPELALAYQQDPSERISDFHFEGCIVKFHEEQGLGTTHINAYSHALNLAQSSMEQFMGFATSFRVHGAGGKNKLARFFDKGEGHWIDQGERLEDSTGNDFPASSPDLALRLSYAFRHAAGSAERRSRIELLILDWRRGDSKPPVHKMG